ncbi:hypothetical protein LSCM1_03283 [Leishmania martiniquensis]|uniref:Transmembrane protein n=1 Tax=Leishmania martiniquensis TaxID=1580590 RepID=A0A836GV55_9TRYP|nr:hypothetical protein LSCM1_03283 [Leishmania martiniquensis]
MGCHRKVVRATSVAVALAVMGVAALCCTPALCISVTAPTGLESTCLTEGIPQMPTLAKAFPLYAAPRGARSTGETPPTELAQTFVVGRLHDDASQARAGLPDAMPTGTAATTSSAQRQQAPASFTTPLLQRPLVNREVVHSLERLNKASPSLPSPQRQQLVLSLHRALGQLSVQEDDHKPIAAEVGATPRAASSRTFSASEEGSSTEADYGAVLSSGVIASFTVALVFASLLLTLVLIEVAKMVSAFVEHRRMLAARQAKDADDTAGPQYGDSRDAIAGAHV